MDKWNALEANTTSKDLFVHSAATNRTSCKETPLVHCAYLMRLGRTRHRNAKVSFVLVLVSFLVPNYENTKEEMFTNIFDMLQLLTQSTTLEPGTAVQGVKPSRNHGRKTGFRAVFVEP